MFDKSFKASQRINSIREDGEDAKEKKNRELQKQDALKPDNFDIISTIGNNIFNNLPQGKFFIITKNAKQDDDDDETSSTQIAAEIEPEEFFQARYQALQKQNPGMGTLKTFNQAQKDYLLQDFENLSSRDKNTFLKNLAIAKNKKLKDLKLGVADKNLANRLRYRGNVSDIRVPNTKETPEDVLNAYMASQRIANTSDYLTVGNIKSQLLNSRRTTSKKQGDQKTDVSLKTNAATKNFLGDLLDHFINNPGSRKYPVALIPDLDKFKKTTGVKTEASVVTDFCEILAPVALLTDNLNGNASDTVKKFLGINSFSPNVLKSASINFKPATNGAMIDSIINYNGRNINISSKTNGGRGASLSGLKTAMVEIKNNPDAVKMLNKELKKNPDFLRMYNFILIITSNTPRFDQTFTTLEFFFSGDYDKDLALAKTLDKDRQIPDDAWSRFSKQIKGIYAEYYKFKHAGQTAKAMPAPTMKQFRQALTWAVARQANSTPYFSEMATWIFNHGAVIQVDATTNTGPNAGLKTPDANAILLSNFTGTWPSQCVETVELVEDDTDSFLNRLHINGFAKQFKAGNKFRLNPDEDYTDWTPSRQGLPNRNYDIDDTVDPADRSAGEFPRTKTRNDWQNPQLGNQRRWTASPLNNKGSAINLGISTYQAYQYATMSDQELLAAGVPEGSAVMSEIQKAREKTIQLLRRPNDIATLKQKIAKPGGISMGYIRNMYNQQETNVDLQKYQAVQRLKQLETSDPAKYQLLLQQSGIKNNASTNKTVGVTRPRSGIGAGIGQSNTGAVNAAKQTQIRK